MFAIIGLGSSYCTGSPSSVVQQEVAGKFGQYVHSAPSADIGVGSFHDCHKSNGSSYIMDELDVPQPTYMATSDPNLSKLSSYLTSSS